MNAVGIDVSKVEIFSCVCYNEVTIQKAELNKSLCHDGGKENVEYTKKCQEIYAKIGTG